MHSCACTRSCLFVMPEPTEIFRDLLGLLSRERRDSLGRGDPVLPFQQLITPSELVRGRTEFRSWTDWYSWIERFRFCWT